MCALCLCINKRASWGGKLRSVQLIEGMAGDWRNQTTIKRLKSIMWIGIDANNACSVFVIKTSTQS